MISHPNRRKGPRLYMFKMTLDEINALLATSGNADSHAMAEDFQTQSEGDAFLAALESATAKLNNSN